jgi:hypothetical protein
MKYILAIVCVMGAVVSACAGSNAGNPAGDANADMPGGVIAVQPQTIGVVAYDPNGPAKALSVPTIVGTSGDKASPADPSTPTQDGNSGGAPASR